MLLVIDAGNTNIKFGLFDGDSVVGSWRISTDYTRTGDEYAALLISMMSIKGFSPADVTGVIMSSVAPAINYTLEHMLSHYFNKTPLIVGPGIKTGLNIRLDNPRELGSDIICDCVSAFRRYGGPCVVMDFGTATTLSAITADGQFLGGVICPGVKVSLEALTGRAAKLPNIELTLPPTVIGKNTVASMQSGLLRGYAGQIEYLVSQFKAEMNCPDAKVIATGGMSKTISRVTNCIDVQDGMLTLEGLRLLYHSNT